MRYEVDPHNRLVIRGVRGGRKRSEVRRFRHVIEGRFKTGKNSTLEYHIKVPTGTSASSGPSAPSVANELGLPHQMKFRGTWSLTENHNLRLTLNKWRRQTFGDELTLKGEIIKVDAQTLVFTVTQRTKENVTSTYILKFEGSWQADKSNRLTFRMKREKAGYDILTFDGIWELDRNNKIVYSYERRISRLGKRRRHSLVFDGFWNYARRDVLTYHLESDGDSYLLGQKVAVPIGKFDFRLGKGIAEDGAIKFELGIGISRRAKPVKREIILYGRWKIKGGTGLIFETRHRDGRLRAMKFGAEARLAGDSGIKFALRNTEGRPLGMEFTISKSLLKGGGESFIRFLRSRGEKAVYVGSGFTW